MGILDGIKRLFAAKSNTRPVSAWYAVAWDDEGVSLDVRPPARPAWTARFRWSSIERVCLKMEDVSCSDGIYVFVAGRSSSYAVPTEAKGGTAFLDQLISRGLFDARLAIKAASCPEGLFCWPPDAGQDRRTEDDDAAAPGRPR